MTGPAVSNPGAPLALRFVLSATGLDGLPATPAEVAIAGRSNVGKSSLLNAVAHRKDLAKTSNTPGRTQLLNLFALEEGGGLVGERPAPTVVDLPGYGYSAVPKRVRDTWGPMIEGYLLGRDNLAKVLILVDGEIGPTRLDVAMLEWARASGLAHTVVATKADKVKASKRPARYGQLAAGCRVASADVLWVSARTGTGIDGLRAAMRRWLGEGVGSRSGMGGRQGPARA